MVSSGERLDLLKTLGDNTRYAIYLELARSPSPLSTAQIAESLGLHGNTVRPHLERMKEVGLLESRPEVTGTVGRPQKLYSLAGDAPSLGLEPPVFPMLARMLVDAARQARLDPETVCEAGRSEGRRQARSMVRPSDADSVTSTHHGSIGADGTKDAVPHVLVDLLAMQEQLGFDPAVVMSDDATDRVAHVAFTHCPFSELAAQNPEIICSLHRGLVEGFIDGWSERSAPVRADIEAADADLRLTSFNDVTNRNPCRMELTIE